MYANIILNGWGITLSSVLFADFHGELIVGGCLRRKGNIFDPVYPVVILVERYGADRSCRKRGYFNEG